MTYVVLRQQRSSLAGALGLVLGTCSRVGLEVLVVHHVHVRLLAVGVLLPCGLQRGSRVAAGWSGSVVSSSSSSLAAAGTAGS